LVATRIGNTEIRQSMSATRSALRTSINMIETHNSFDHTRTDGLEMVGATKTLKMHEPIGPWTVLLSGEDSRRRDHLFGIHPTGSHVKMKLDSRASSTIALEFAGYCVDQNQNETQLQPKPPARPRSRTIQVGILELRSPHDDPNTVSKETQTHRKEASDIQETPVYRILRQVRKAEDKIGNPEWTTVLIVVLAWITWIVTGSGVLTAGTPMVWLMVRNHSEGRQERVLRQEYSAQQRQSRIDHPNMEPRTPWRSKPRSDSDESDTNPSLKTPRVVLPPSLEEDSDSEMSTNGKGKSVKQQSQQHKRTEAQGAIPRLSIGSANVGASSSFSTPEASLITTPRSETPDPSIDQSSMMAESSKQGSQTGPTVVQNFMTDEQMERLLRNVVNALKPQGPKAAGGRMPDPGKGIVTFKGYGVTDWLENFEMYAEIYNIEDTAKPGHLMRYVDQSIYREVRDLVEKNDWDATQAAIKKHYRSTDLRQLQSPEKRLKDHYRVKIGGTSDHVKAWLTKLDALIKEAKRETKGPDMEDVWPALPLKLTAYLVTRGLTNPTDFKAKGYDYLKTQIEEVTRFQSELEIAAHHKGEKLDTVSLPFERMEVGKMVEKLESYQQLRSDQDYSGESQRKYHREDTTKEPDDAKQAPKPASKRTQSSNAREMNIEEITARLGNLEISLNQMENRIRSGDPPALMGSQVVPYGRVGTHHDAYTPMINQIEENREDPEINQMGGGYRGYRGAGKQDQRSGASYQCYWCGERGHGVKECSIYTKDESAGLTYYNEHYQTFQIGNRASPDPVIGRTAWMATLGTGLRDYVIAMGLMKRDLSIATLAENIRAKESLRRDPENDAQLRHTAATIYDQSIKNSEYAARMRRIWEPKDKQEKDSDKEGKGQGTAAPSINNLIMLDKNGHSLHNYPNHLHHNEVEPGINLLFGANDSETEEEEPSGINNQEQPRKRPRQDEPGEVEEDTLKRVPSSIPAMSSASNSIDQTPQASQTQPPATEQQQVTSDRAKAATGRKAKPIHPETRKQVAQRTMEAYMGATVKVSLADIAMLSKDVGTGVTDAVRDLTDGMTRRVLVNDDDEQEVMDIPRGINMVSFDQPYARDSEASINNYGTHDATFDLDGPRPIRRLAYLACRVGPVGGEEIIRGCLDSGAEANIISSAYVQRNGLAMIQEKSSSVAYGGGKVEFLGRVVERVWIAGTPIEVAFFVAEAKVVRQDLLLGLPFFSQTRLNFEYNDRGDVKAAVMTLQNSRIVAALTMIPDGLHRVLVRKN